MKRSSVVVVVVLLTSAVAVGWAVPSFADSVSAVDATTLLTGVACGSATACIATGQAGAQTSGVVAPIVNGKVAGAQQVAGTNELTGAACASATDCFAVGVGNEASDGMLVRVTNGTAGGALSVSGTAFLQDVACASATSCVAVGWQIGNYNDGNGRIGVVVPINDGTPGGAQQVPGTLDVLGVDCPTSTSCVGVGTAASGFDGAVVPISGGAAGGVATVGGLLLNDIACAGERDCVAVGTFNGPGGGGGAVVPITNGAPGAAQKVAGINALSGVACPSTSRCSAVGWWSGGTLGAVVPITDGSPGSVQAEPATFQLYGIACPSDTGCIAAGDDSSSGHGIVVSVTSAGVGEVQGPNDLYGPEFPKDKQDARADLGPALGLATTFCVPAALGLAGLGAGVLFIGTAGGIAVAGALTAAATVPFCAAVLKRVATDYRRYHDPPDSSYGEVATPAPVAAVRMPSCDRWQDSDLAFCRTLSAAEMAWVESAQALASVDEALATTMDRECGAVAAGDAAAARRQDDNLRMLEQQEHKVVADLNASEKAMLRRLAEQHVAYRMTKAQSTQVVKAVEQRLAEQDVTAADLEKAVGAKALQPRAVDLASSSSSSSSSGSSGMSPAVPLFIALLAMGLGAGLFVAYRKLAATDDSSSGDES